MDHAFDPSNPEADLGTYLGSGRPLQIPKTGVDIIEINDADLLNNQNDDTLASIPEVEDIDDPENHSA